MTLPKYVPQLDVLRGAAVLAVILCHGTDAFPSLHLRPVFQAGSFGVDLFFVLSGFLITGILLDTKGHPHYFRNFYARRVLRIWPLYYALLFLTFVVLPLAQPRLTREIFQRSHPWQTYLFLVQNLFGNPQRAYDTVRVTWSLAIEEQFYLVWPLVVFLAPRRALKPLALGAVAFSLAARWSGQYGGLIPPVHVYSNTMTRLDGLALGAFLAVWLPELEDRVVRLAGIATLAVAAPTAITVATLRPGHCILYALVAASFAALLCVAITLPLPPGSGFLKYTGKISYCLYLVHVPVFMVVSFGLGRLVSTRWPTIIEALSLVASLGLCYGIAAASWQFYESPFLRLKSHFESPRASKPRESPYVRKSQPQEPSPSGWVPVRSDQQ